MQERLPKAILKFRKIGLSAPWGDYLTTAPAFKDEVSAFLKSDLFEMPYFQNINPRKLVDNLQKGDCRMIPYIMPLFMMHIWMKNYVEKFTSI